MPPSPPQSLAMHALEFKSKESGDTVLKFFILIVHYGLQGAPSSLIPPGRVTHTHIYPETSGLGRRGERH